MDECRRKPRILIEKMGYKNNMKPSDIYEVIREHINENWPIAAKKEFYWDNGPAQASLPNLRICRVSPIDEKEPWVYVSIGIWEVMAEESTCFEFFVLSPTETPIHIETLAILSFYHRQHRLNVGQIIDIGREWLEKSKMHHFLVSLPYPYGSSFEYCHANNSKIVRFLWLLPITEQEAYFADKFGVEALEKKFDEYQIDVVDLNRKSVV